MKTSERFTNAVTKLYNAFHKGELNAMDTCACAVGNICNNTPEWSRINLHTENAINTGYSAKELWRIELLFMFGKDGERDAEVTKQPRYNDNVFEALCDVIEYLCELDGIPNVMDYSKLFETENNEPKYKLETVL